MNYIQNTFELKEKLIGPNDEEDASPDSSGGSWFQFYEKDYSYSAKNIFDFNSQCANQTKHPMGCTRIQLFGDFS